MPEKLAASRFIQLRTLRRHPELRLYEGANGQPLYSVEIKGREGEIARSLAKAIDGTIPQSAFTGGPDATIQEASTRKAITSFLRGHLTDWLETDTELGQAHGWNASSKRRPAPYLLLFRRLDGKKDVEANRSKKRTVLFDIDTLQVRERVRSLEKLLTSDAGPIARGADDEWCQLEPLADACERASNAQLAESLRELAFWLDLGEKDPKQTDIVELLGNDPHNVPYYSTLCCCLARCREIATGRPARRSKHRGETSDDHVEVVLRLKTKRPDPRELKEELRKRFMKRPPQPLDPTMLFGTEIGAQRWAELRTQDSYVTGKAFMNFFEANKDLLAETVRMIFGSVLPDVVSLGAGDGIKDTKLLGLLLGGTTERPAYYYPFDYSIQMILSATMHARKSLTKAVRVVGTEGDIADIAEFAEEYTDRPAPNLYVFLGNTIGNQSDDLSKLAAIHQTMEKQDVLLVEIRLVIDQPAHQNGEPSINEVMMPNYGMDIPTRTLLDDFNRGPIESAEVPFDRTMEFIYPRLKIPRTEFLPPDGGDETGVASYLACVVRSATAREFEKDPARLAPSVDDIIYEGNLYNRYPLPLFRKKVENLGFEEAARPMIYNERGQALLWLRRSA